MASEEQKGEGEMTTVPVEAVEEETKAELCRCVVLTGHGRVDKICVEKRAKPKPDVGQVLIKVHACGLNFADIMQRQGSYRPAPPLPYVMGYECSGVIEEIGDQVTGVEVGDRVVAVCAKLGMMAEYVAVCRTLVTTIPDSMSFEDAAALPLNYITAYNILFDIGNLKEGKSVLVHMAAGGVGIAASQLCKSVPEVTVFGTASQPKHEKIKTNGVTHAIDYRNNDYAKEIAKVQKGVDIVMDPLGGKDTQKGYDLLNPFGTIVCYGMANAVSGEKKSLFTMAKTWYQTNSYSPMKLMMDSKVIAGYHLGVIGMSYPEIAGDTLSKLIKLYEEGKIKPEIYTVMSLEEIGDAMACLESRKNVGKVLLSPLKEPPKPEEKVDEKKAEDEAAAEGDKKETTEETKVEDGKTDDEKKPEESAE